MFNEFRDKKRVEQNPLTLVNKEEVWKTGIVPATTVSVSYNNATIDSGFDRAPDDIFGTIRAGRSYFNTNTESNTESDD